MDKNTIISIFLGVMVFILIIISVVLIINQMEERFMNDCEKQDFQGNKEYWDLDINCSQIEKIPELSYSGQVAR